MIHDTIFENSIQNQITISRIKHFFRAKTPQPERLRASPVILKKIGPPQLKPPVSSTVSPFDNTIDLTDEDDLKRSPSNTVNSPPALVAIPNQTKANVANNKQVKYVTLNTNSAQLGNPTRIAVQKIGNQYGMFCDLRTHTFLLKINI